MFEIKQYRCNLGTKQFLWGQLEAAMPDFQQTFSLYPSAHLRPRCINFVSSPHHRQQPCKARSRRCGLASEYQLPRETIMFAQWRHEFSSRSSGMLSVLTDLVGGWFFLRLLPFHQIWVKFVKRVQQLWEGDLQPDWKPASSHKQYSHGKEGWKNRVDYCGGKKQSIKTFLEEGEIKNDSDFLDVLVPEEQQVKRGNEMSYHPSTDRTWKCKE